jgi:hypothetical protein
MRLGGTSRVPYGFARRATVIAVTVFAALTATANAATPRCFGAASRAPGKPCVNPALQRSVTPTPEDALLEPSAACSPVKSVVPPSRCAFGVSKARAVATVALVGDSHAVHWRAALEHVFRVHRWRGITLYRSQCPFTAARTSLPEPDGSGCQEWKLQTLAYLQQHPEIGTIFVSHRRGRRGAERSRPFRGQDRRLHDGVEFTPGHDRAHHRPA